MVCNVFIMLSLLFCHTIYSLRSHKIFMLGLATRIKGLSWVGVSVDSP